MYFVFTLTEWCKIYKERAPHQKELQNEIDQFMTSYDEKIEEVGYYFILLESTDTTYV